MREQDTPKFQMARLEKLLAERAPGKGIEFDLKLGSIRFRIFDLVTGTELVKPDELGWRPSNLADIKSDDVLWAKICRSSNGKLSSIEQ
ncbi:MAG TPA: hypothetical protein VFQ43_12560 [Nitrososphaera sp.]|nr:hypothetical protein [Nitrososphaera sp.]